MRHFIKVNSEWSGVKMAGQARQLRGDPSIRQFLFSQTRTESPFDTGCEQLMDRIEELFSFHGAFHIQIEMSTCQMMVWSLDDPFNYQVFVGEEVFDAMSLQRSATTSYPDNAQIRPNAIRPLLERFRILRLADEKVYLRSGSINIMNGLLRLNFSCDGTHYVDHADFLASPLYEV